MFVAFLFVCFSGVFVVCIIVYINCLLINSTFYKRIFSVGHRRDSQIIETMLQSSSSSYITTTTPNTNNRRARRNEVAAANTSVQRATTTSRRVTAACSDPLSDTFLRQTGFLYGLTIGGVGNHLFVYASTYGIAVRCNRTLVTVKSDVLNRYFNLEATRVDECVIRTTKVKVLVENQASAFDNRYFHLPADKNIIIGYYLQSWKYFENVIPQLKEQFTFKTEISKRADETLSNISTDFLKRQHSKGITAQNITFVGVHVRRGDMVAEKQFVEFGYQVAPIQYIHKAMKFFTDKFKTVLYIVCSDSMEWAKNNIKNLNVVFVHDEPEVDMSVLIHCNHTIITVGTFGWWSGFLAGGITVYYKHPARNSSKHRKTFSKTYSDYFYPGWIAME